MLFTWNIDETRTERVVIARPSHSYNVSIVAKMFGRSLLLYYEFGDFFEDTKEATRNLDISTRLIKRKLPKIKKGLKSALESNEYSGSFDVGLAHER